MSATYPVPNDRPLEARLADPDAWHRPAAYWFWHHLPDPEEIRRQVREMKDAGIHSFQIQARMAYPIEGYLDEDYLEACRIAVDEAARLGMMVGVYDDYNWQTGHAGGRAVAGHDHLRERQLFWTSGSLRDGHVLLSVDGIHTATEDLGPAGMAWHYDNGVSQWGDWEIAFAFAGEGEQAVDITQLAHIVDYRIDGCAIEVTTDLPEGTSITVFVAARNTTSRLVNFMDRAAAARFVEAGYQPFHDALGEHFGSTITYFFFDQPHANFYTWAQMHGDLKNAMPYRSDLPRVIRGRWLGQHAQVMLALLDGDDLATRALRAQFYEFFSREAMDVFLGELRRWTSERGVALSGHEVLAHVGSWNLSDAFGGWDLRVNFGLDYFRIDSYRDLTGVDAQDTVPQLSAKMGDSVARANGRSGTIVEQYFAKAHAGSGTYAGNWGLSLEDLRAQTIRHHILGMRQLLFHGFYQTDGFDDDPRMFSNPRFDFPPGENFLPWFSGYHADFAIETARLSEFMEGAEPTCDIALLYPLRTVWTDGQNGAHAREVGAWAEYLSSAGYGYHLVDEETLADAVIDGGRVRFGSRDYGTLVLPGVTTLRSAGTVEVLAHAAAGGVTIVASGATPTTYQVGPQSAAADFAALGAKQVETALDASALDALALKRAADSAAVSPSAPIWWWVGRDEGEQRIALFNDTDADVVVGIAGEGPLSRVGDGGMIAVTGGSLTVAPMELVLIIGTSSDTEAPLAWTSGDSVEVVDGWTLQFDGDSKLHEIQTTAGWEMQGFQTYSGVGRYRAEIELPTAASIAITLPSVAGSAAVSVNGHPVGRRGWRPFVFRAGATATLAGRNVIEIEVASSAANRYYAGTGYREAPEPAGLLADPVIRMNGNEKEN